VNAETGDQVTRWIYGTTLTDSAVASNNLLRTKIYPESDDRPAPAADGPDGVYARLEYTYNRQGQPLSFKDADLTQHDYVYDKLSRLTADKATELGDGLSSAVRRIGRTYDVRGFLDKVTSYSTVSGSVVVNEVQLVYDPFGNLVEDRQSHSGAVTGTTPKVVYVYTDGSNNKLRKVSVTYPNGRVLTYHYGTANSIDDHLNRVSDERVTGESDHLVDYRYVGEAWQSRISYPQPSIMCDYKKQSGEPDGDAGDPYSGYDRFGRTVDIRWIKPIT
jgi:YD repeat-containing protein